MKTSYPLIYQQVLKSRLIDPEQLRSVYDELRGRLVGLEELDMADAPEESDGSSVFPVSGGESEETLPDNETDFELGDPSLMTSEAKRSDESIKSEENGVVPQSPLQEELERIFPAELELRGLLNHWQVSQLLLSRTRFYLGRYRIVDSLGAGGYGHVFLARTDLDPSNRGRLESGEKRFTDVAVKVLPLTGATPKAVRKFRREIGINSDLSHPNLVRFIESAVDGNVHYAVYEYMDGGDCRQFDGRTIQTDFRVASAIIRETAKGLLYLHSKGVVHRDVKPGNILLTRGGGVKLGDLGLAVSPRTPDLEIGDEPSNDAPKGKNPVPDGRRKIEGTSDYLSPDQVLSTDTPSPTWDIYSLGCTFYYLVTGIVPFPSGNTAQKIHAHLKSDAPDPQMFNVHLPSEVAQLIREMMDKRAENRPRADALLRRLRPWVADKNELAEFLGRLANVQATVRVPERVIEVSLDDILDDENAFEGESTSNSTAESMLIPTERPTPPTATAARDWASVRLDGERSAERSFLENLNTILVWFVLLPLSLIGLALFLWIWFLS